MRSVIILLCATLAGGCASLPETRLSAEDLRICTTQTNSEGRFAILKSAFNSACMEFGAPERIRGVWFRGFEEGRLVEGAESLPKKRPRYRTHLVYFEDPMLDAVLPKKQHPACNEVFYLEFLGRRAIREFGRDGVRRLGSALEYGEIEVIQAEQILEAKFLGFVIADFRSGKPIVLC